MVYKNFILRSIFSILFLLIYLFISYFNFSNIFYLIICIYCLIFLEIFLYFKIYRIFPIIYLFISLVFFIGIDFNESIYVSFHLLIFTIITFDIFSYLVGKLIGKSQITKISPNKTFEGLIGGFSISLILTLYLSFYLEYGLNFYQVFYFILIILSGFIGDMIQSYCKRKNNLKNSSKFIPGHGGVFDRFDSFLFSIIIYSININFIL